MVRGARWMFVVAFGWLTVSCTENASAHFPFRHGCHVRPFCPAPVVWGGSCWPSYGYYSSSFYVGSYYPYSNCFAPRVYYRPVIYSPVVYPSVWYDPFCVQPIAYPTVVYRSYYSRPTIATSWTVASTAPVSQRNVPRATSVQPLVQNRLAANTRPARPQSTPVLTSYSPVWTEYAVRLIDDMIKEGEWELAHQSLERMKKISTPLSHRVVLRQAVMDLVASRDAMNASQMDGVMDLLSKAADAGSRFDADELGGVSLSEYLTASRIDLDAILDQLAERALKHPERSGREMVLLSVLLKLDGQSDRAALFAHESRTLAARSDAFRWQSVLRSLDLRSESDALLAARD